MYHNESKGNDEVKEKPNIYHFNVGGGRQILTQLKSLVFFEKNRFSGCFPHTNKKSDDDQHCG